ncbi:MAG: serine/threonine-protein kinase [bacterium]
MTAEPGERKRRIEAKLSTPAEPSDLSTIDAAALPDDILRAAARRLSIAACVWAGLWSFGLLMNNVVARLISPDRVLDDAWPWPGNPVAIVCVAVSLAIAAIARREKCDCRRLVAFAHIYELILALGIGIVNQWTPNTVGLSWICVLILLHPLIVPGTPGLTLATSLAAATMDPIGIAITAMRGIETPPAVVVLWTYLPNYVCAFLTLVPTRVIARLGREVTQARQLGSYQLGDLIGRGGMGEVYRATHRMLARPAAIKLIRPELLGAGSGRDAAALVERFRREAHAAAMLASPHTIRLYDFGVTNEGTFFYVMELLDGIDLRALVDRFGPVSPERAVHILLQTSRSLGEAHARGLVHRDIKPSNIFACRVGLEVDFVKVLDFGLVKMTSRDDGDAPTISAPQAATGTPAFIAPETALGDRPTDHRSDIYSLGCVAYWLLTGRLVFEAETAVQMIVKHVDATPVPPSRISELEIPPSLDALVLSCLAKNPAERPRDAAELARRLEECAAHAPWTQERAHRWWEAHLHTIAGASSAVRRNAPATVGHSAR